MLCAAFSMSLVNLVTLSFSLFVNSAVVLLSTNIICIELVKVSLRTIWSFNCRSMSSAIRPYSVLYGLIAVGSWLRMFRKGGGALGAGVRAARLSNRLSSSSAVWALGLRCRSSIMRFLSISRLWMTLI